MKRRSDTLGIYVHVPFCLEKCSYCDFYSLGAGRSDEASLSGNSLRSYLDALGAEFHARIADFRHCPEVDSVYFGGGTASLLPPDAIRSLLDLFRREFSFSPVAEITVEGNPTQMDREYMGALAKAGVNRINVGIQSFSPLRLAAVGRRYDPLRYEQILEDLRNSPIAHRGADLIYGIPGQSEEEFFRDLDRLTEVGVDHLSLYALTAEPGTPYGRDVESGKASPPDEELQTRILAKLPEIMDEKGLPMYEISNFARPGSLCRHNLRYWLYEPYMGLGPAAHGFDGRWRYGNPPSLERWLRDPAGVPKTLHDPLLELPLGLLRITRPIPLSLMEGVLREYERDFRSDARSMEFVVSLVRRWEADGFVCTETIPSAANSGPSDLSGISGVSDISRKSGILSGSDTVFQWTVAGILHLDDRIREMALGLDEIRGNPSGL